VISTLSFFGLNNERFVREIWSKINNINFWNEIKLRITFYNTNDFYTFPLKPNLLRKFIIDSVVNKKLYYQNLYPNTENNIIEDYKNLLNSDGIKYEIEEKMNNAVYLSWLFIHILRGCKNIVLFSQRNYINKKISRL